jgi:hypothetical protein
MSTIVIMPGGFHPFHAGHAALYQSAVKAFPGAEVFVAATNDTSNRPFPFPIKEKLAKLAGVQPGHFVQVKSPFRAEEITAKFDPEKDRLIFVRSEKDADKPPQAGGVKKNGEPAYLQPLAGQTNIAPFGKHAYMAYLPTVEFGPGMTSATEIRTAWPQLNDKRKTALVMSLYPQTQQNSALAANVVKMLDTAIGGELAESNMLGHVMFKSKPTKFKKIQPAVSRTKDFMKKDFSLSEDDEVEENQGWAATFTSEETGQMTGTPAIGGMWAGYQDRENQPIGEKKTTKFRDPELIKTQQFVNTHYPTYDPDTAFKKWIQRSLKHSEEEDQQHDRVLSRISNKVDALSKKINSMQKSDYIEEKWSQKYKSSINCDSPKGFSQRAHCAGRKK